MIRKIRLVALLFAVLGLLACSSRGAVLTNNWVWGGSNGFWQFSTNWGLGAPTTNTAFVQINLAGVSKTIIIDSNTPATNLTINGLLLASAGSKSNWLVVSNLAPVAAPFRILGGAFVGGPSGNQGRLIVTNSVVILNGTNGNGLTVSNGLVALQPGAEMRLTNGAMAQVGLGANGTLTVATNAAFRVAVSNLVVG